MATKLKPTDIIVLESEDDDDDVVCTFAKTSKTTEIVVLSDTDEPAPTARPIGGTKDESNSLLADIGNGPMPYCGSPDLVCTSLDELFSGSKIDHGFNLDFKRGLNDEISDASASSKSTIISSKPTSHMASLGSLLDICMTASSSSSGTYGTINLLSAGKATQNNATDSSGKYPDAVQCDSKLDLQFGYVAMLESKASSVSIKTINHASAADGRSMSPCALTKPVKKEPSRKRHKLFDPSELLLSESEDSCGDDNGLPSPNSPPSRSPPMQLSPIVIKPLNASPLTNKFQSKCLASLSPMKDKPKPPISVYNLADSDSDSDTSLPDLNSPTLVFPLSVSSLVNCTSIQPATSDVKYCTTPTLCSRGSTKGTESRSNFHSYRKKPCLSVSLCSTGICSSSVGAMSNTFSPLLLSSTSPSLLYTPSPLFTPLTDDLSDQNSFTSNPLQTPLVSSEKSTKDIVSDQLLQSGPEPVHAEQNLVDMAPASSVTSSQEAVIALLNTETIEKTVSCVRCQDIKEVTAISFCQEQHPTCGTCLQKDVKWLLAESNKGSIQCRHSSCESQYAIDELTKSLPSMVVEILEDKVKKERIDSMITYLIGGEDQAAEAGSAADEGKNLNKDAVTFEKPEYWIDMPDLPQEGYIKVPVDVSGNEFSWISKIFHSSMAQDKTRITKLFRVQNPTLWQFYCVKREQMKKANGPDKYHERWYFHGTKAGSITSICKSNFDWRLCGTNGTVYGDGSYFGLDASYSHRYTDRQISTNTPHVSRKFPPSMKYNHSMFLARVLVGNSTLGRQGMKKPPQMDPSNPDSPYYDSCVNSLSRPTFFVIFDFTQCYPEYVLEYECTANYTGV